MTENLKTGPARGAVFFDRDGVLNIDSGFPHHSSQITWVDGAFDAVRRLNDQGMFVFVVTNQSGIARGLYTEDHVRALHDWMAQEFKANGARIDDFAYCPHHPEGQVEQYKITCDCRKPAAGMLHALMKAWPVDTKQSFMIGDRETDIQAAQAAGLPGHLFRGGNLDGFVKDILAR